MFTMLKRILTLVLTFMCAGAALADWTSPHDLKLEEKAPSALIPFPREVNWSEEELMLPTADGWKLKGPSANAWVRAH